eukprot:9347184-Prorocentrum_lima.AAC.1
MIRAGRKARPHPGFMATSPAQVSVMGVALPWAVVTALPPGGLDMTSRIAALNLLRLVGKEGHLRRTLRELGVQPDA